MLADRTLRDLLASFASPDPTPGGGSASALAAALGASLLRMVSALPKTRNGTEVDRAALSAAGRTLGEIQPQLVDAVDADASAYDRVLSAYRLPRATDEERAARTRTIQDALRGATEVPLLVLRLAVRSMTQGEAVAAHGHTAAATDVGVASELLRAAFEGARLNAEANLGHVSEPAYRERVRAEVDALAASMSRSVSTLKHSLRG